MLVRRVKLTGPSCSTPRWAPLVILHKTWDVVVQPQFLKNLDFNLCGHRPPFLTIICGALFLQSIFFYWLLLDLLLRINISWYQSHRSHLMRTSVIVVALPICLIAHPSFVRPSQNCWGCTVWPSHFHASLSTLPLCVIVHDADHSIPYTSFCTISMRHPTWWREPVVGSKLPQMHAIQRN